ncbi:CDP-alcohol phosphatidyltransferase family protein [Sphingomonas parva]|uniref:CDP-alcohol phosphatidyltransferase family protein n=1 Tax=Sphingomonas parva TaxID=2555898 RepID=A0A4Y8ZTI7_9SPHN|nr:CDP-alcohol phosphatidyltransferase family protein [Sphingomonas parva]TFI58612.1 CDP-alcohol phosphatidyltransferase family protein [Sphingomonas parva]
MPWTDGIDGETGCRRGRIATVVFAGAAEANARVAGVAAAARIVRALAEAGFAEARLEFRGGGALDAAAAADVERLAGPLCVQTAPAVSEAEGLRLDGAWLVPAAALAGKATTGASGALRLAAPSAAAEILRGTGKASDGPVSRSLNRPISRWISARLLRLEWIRPVHATAGTALLALLMVAALLAGGEAGLLAGALLFHAASVFDGVDGEIARATFRTSKAGALLDSLIDEATNLLFVLGVTINLGLAGARLAVFLGLWGLGLFACGLAVIAWRAARSAGPFSFDLVKHHYRRRCTGAAPARLMRFLTIVTCRDFYALLFLVLILIGRPMAVLLIFAAAATIWILFVLAALAAPASARPRARGSPLRRVQS